MNQPASITPLIDTLYREHHSWLFAWLRKKLGCPHHAADLAHDTFIRILSLSHAPCLHEPRAYLTITAKRLIIDQARRRQIEQSYLAELALAAKTTRNFPSPVEILAVIQALTQISAALDGLAEKPRQAFLLHYLDGQTHAAVASQLGVSTRMIQKYLIQALVHCHQTCYSN
ncbi:MAG: sigma-70 family RNA polymerase sigma factor [Nitrosospira sp.]|nr:sigma-70 family RNA polymerase sigma factor [Nitrosospira sp.]